RRLPQVCSNSGTLKVRSEVGRARKLDHAVRESLPRRSRAGAAFGFAYSSHESRTADSGTRRDGPAGPAGGHYFRFVGAFAFIGGAAGRFPASRGIAADQSAGI